jgi:pimeloyl-ACP methyl ester carboxylesterase
MSQFLLVHGAFHGAWCWRKTVAELERRGHRAKAIDLPGQGEDRTPLKEVTLDTMVDRIIAEMADLPGKVVLVGHSLGGIPISVTGEKSPDRIKALVYLSAFLPRDGEALLDIENRNPKQCGRCRRKRAPAATSPCGTHDEGSFDAGALRPHSASLCGMHRRSCALYRHATGYDRKVSAG